MLLGPNGAVKEYYSIDSDEILYQGESIEKNLQAFKEKLGMVSQNLALYEDLTTPAAMPS